MVKSVVKAMDVLQAFGKQEWGEPINGFIVSGIEARLDDMADRRHRPTRSRDCSGGH